MPSFNILAILQSIEQPFSLTTSAFSIAMWQADICSQVHDQASAAESLGSIDLKSNVTEV